MQVNFNFSVNIDDRIISFFKRIFTIRKIFFAIMIALITVALNASVPVTFTPGTTIIASDVNSNFDALDTRITTLEGIWSTDSTNVYRQTGNVGIGTSSPGAKLEVNGFIYGNFIVAGRGNAILLGENGANAKLSRSSSSCPTGSVQIADEGGYRLCWDGDINIT